MRGHNTQQHINIRRFTGGQPEHEAGDQAYRRRAERNDRIDRIALENRPEQIGDNAGNRSRPRPEKHTGNEQRGVFKAYAYGIANRYLKKFAQYDTQGGKESEEHENGNFFVFHLHIKIPPLFSYK